MISICNFSGELKQDEYGGIEKMVINASSINLETAFRSFNVIDTANKIIELYLEDSSNFKQRFLHLSFIKEPINPKFSEKDLLFLEEVSLQIMNITRKDLFFEKLNIDIQQIFFSYYSISKNLFSNTQKLNSLKLASLPLKKQLYEILLFISNELAVLNNQHIEINKNLITGSEPNLSNFKIGDSEGLAVSYTEIFEAHMESINSLIPYLYFLKKDSIDTNLNEITNFENNDENELRKLFFLAHQRWMLTILWGRFKYSNHICRYIEDSGEFNKIFLIEPDQVKLNLEKNIFIGGQRLSYHYHINLSKTMDKGAKNKLFNSLKYIEKKFLNYSLNEFLNITKESYIECVTFAQINISSQEKLIDPYYLSIDYQKHSYKEILNCIEFLLTIALFMESHSKDKIDFIRLDTLVKAFSYFYSLDILKARGILNLFISKPKEKVDLFSKPLIYSGNNEILVFSEFIDQINIPRLFDELIKVMQIDSSKKGIIYEDQLKEILKNNDFVKVNTNEVKFIASDGREVEYDFLGYFNEYLIIMEFKNCYTPYSNKEYNSTLDIIEFGVEQVNRREKIVYSDWQTIKKLVNIELPTDPPTKKKIIKILCTNIYHFTSLKINDVFITDSSALIKFFYYPLNGVRAASSELSSDYINAGIWSSIPPSKEDLINYLHDPSAMREYRNVVKELYKPIKLVSKDDPLILYHDFSLIEDPYHSIIMTEENKRTIAKKMVRLKTISRNDKCFCRSNKKFKNCCMKLIEYN